MDIRGSELNEENVLGILDADFGRRLEQTFREDLERSEEIRSRLGASAGGSARFGAWPASSPSSTEAIPFARGSVPGAREQGSSPGPRPRGS
jgi:phosphatidylserine/phosphatidylglycerophosphate/cardiolipin synthase-like enzyme